MDLSIVAAVLLLANAVFNIVAWPQFLRRVQRDPRARDAAGKRTTFLTVHLVIVTIAVVLGVVSGIVGILLLVA